MKLSSKTVHNILTRWMDEGIVTDHAADYGEPGYSHSMSLTDEDTPIVVLGSYWCECKKVFKDTHDGGRAPVIHPYEHHRPRLWQQLADQGVTFEWYDEWTVVDGKAYRTSPDSYSWMSSIVWNGCDNYLTPEQGLDEWVEWAAEYNEGEGIRCLPSIVWSGRNLLTCGFEKWNGTYESGWHPGQDDNPHDIRKLVLAAWAFTSYVAGVDEECDVVFCMDGVGQFDVNFSAYYRVKDWEENSE